MATSARSCSPGLLLVFLLAVCAASDSGERVRVTPTVIGCYPAATNGSRQQLQRDGVPRQPPPAPWHAPLGRRADGLRYPEVRPRARPRGLLRRRRALRLPRVPVGAGQNLTDGCGATTRLAGVWNDGCFVSYADTVAPSATTLLSTALVPRSEPSDPNDSNGFINLTLGLLYALVAMQFVT